MITPDNIIILHRKNDNEPVYININFIHAITTHKEATIVDVDTNAYHVKESPETIFKIINGE